MQNCKNEIHLIENYQKINNGEFGIVWKCCRKSDGEIIVIKELPYDEEKSVKLKAGLFLNLLIFYWKNYNEKCDIWKLGCTAYKIATLHPPFESKKGNIFDLFQKIQNEDIQAFDSQGYSSNLFNIIKSMLEKDPMKRPNIKEILEISISK